MQYTMRVCCMNHTRMQCIAWFSNRAPKIVGRVFGRNVPIGGSQLEAESVMGFLGRGSEPPPFQLGGLGEHCKRGSVADRSGRKRIWCVFGITEHFWWKENAGRRGGGGHDSLSASPSTFRSFAGFWAYPGQWWACSLLLHQLMGLWSVHPLAFCPVPKASRGIIKCIS